MHQPRVSQLPRHTTYVSKANAESKRGTMHHRSRRIAPCPRPVGLRRSLRLFSEHPDLLDEFKNFLPDRTPVNQQGSARSKGPKAGRGGSVSEGPRCPRCSGAGTATGRHDAARGCGRGGTGTGRAAATQRRGERYCCYTVFLFSCFAYTVLCPFSAERRATSSASARRADELIKDRRRTTGDRCPWVLAMVVSESEDEEEELIQVAEEREPPRRGGPCGPRAGP